MLLGFKKQFIQPVLVESKGLTLRNPRKYEPKIGETLYMYSGLRTKNSQHITSKHTLKSTQKVKLKIQRIEKEECFKIKVIIDKRQISYDELKELVILDGFEFIDDWANYWLDGKRKIEAKVNMYHWTDKRF